MLSLSRLQFVLVETLKANADFSAIVLAEIGTPLNWYIDTDYQEAVETPPYLLSLKLPKSDALPTNPEWALQFIVAMAWDNKPVIINGITKFTAPEKVENVADKMVSIIRERVASLSVDGTDLNITSVISVPPEVGETKEQQMIVTIVFESERTLNGGC